MEILGIARTASVCARGCNDVGATGEVPPAQAVSPASATIDTSFLIYVSYRGAPAFAGPRSFPAGRPGFMRYNHNASQKACHLRTMRGWRRPTRGGGVCGAVVDRRAS
jgi:hypothetical protein